MRLPFFILIPRPALTLSLILLLAAAPTMARAAEPSVDRPSVERPSAETASAATRPPRLLFIALDAVPYTTMAKVTDPSRGEAALFRDLTRPVPLISTFPSTTSLAFAGILEPLGLEKSPGYEAKFYDWERDKVRGGGPFSYDKIDFPWRRFWDWKLHGVVAKVTSGARPVKVVKKNIRRGLEAFAASDKQVYFLYFTTTDIVSHLKGPDGLDPLLALLDESIAELREETDPFQVVLFSDHGMDGGKPLRNILRPLKRALRGEGFKVKRKLKTENHVVFVPFGLVSSFVAFTRPGHEVEVARILGKVDGIDICAAREARDDAAKTAHSKTTSWRVLGPAGEARIVLERRGDERSHDDLYTYERIEGDPLDLAEIVERLGDPTQSDGAWLDATRTRAKPDPLYRIVRGFDIVENSASILCGLAKGSMYGSLGTEFASRLSVGRLKWTHGALHRDASLGFVMSDVPGWVPPSSPVRFDEALPPFATGYEETIEHSMTSWTAH